MPSPHLRTCGITAVTAVTAVTAITEPSVPPPSPPLLFCLCHASPHPTPASPHPCTQIAGQGLTSLVLHEEGDDGKGLDWAAELLLLTHEPLRRDMLEMQRALQPRYFGELPDSWRVHSFFRFYQSWCSLVSQQHAVEVSVHYDWLVAPTNKMQGEHRSELLSYHRTIELEVRSA